jgi:hypothetical protein
MQMNTNMALAGVILASTAITASAALVQVDVVGEIDFNGIGFGSFGSLPAGTPVTMSFQVDSNTFVNGSFPTRGYEIIPSSFSLTVGAATVGLANPYPAGDTPYFVIRNNDPGVDGFLLASSPDAPAPDGVWISEPAIIDPTFHSIFSATYGPSTLPSLDILDAVGTYTFDGLSVFNWGLEDAGFQPTGFIFEQFTIAVVPAPGAAWLGLAGVLAMARRRR